jgi:hypothetical protein
MSNKKLGLVLLGVAIVVIAGFGVFALTKNSEPEKTVNTTQTQANSQQVSQDNSAPEQNKSYTAEEVAKHASTTDCWTIIEGKVYDITAYVPRHPGGDEILRACGAEGTSLFSQRQTESGEPVGSGTPHAGSAKSQLASMQVGVLAD